MTKFLVGAGFVGLAILGWHHMTNTPDTNPAGLAFTDKEKAWLAEFDPRARPIAERVLAGCKRAGLDYSLGQAFRPLADSAAKFAAFVAGTGPRAAPPGKSPHNHTGAGGIKASFAGDVDLFIGTGKARKYLPDDAPGWQLFRRIVRAAGGKSGGDFSGQKDFPHFELPGWERLV